MGGGGEYYIKNANTWRLNNMFLVRSLKKTKRKSKYALKQNPEPMGCSKSSAKPEVYSKTSLPQKMRKTLNKQPNLTPNATRERRKPTGRN